MSSFQPHFNKRIQTYGGVFSYASKIICDMDCQTIISAKVADFSLKKYGKSMCIDCQKKEDTRVLKVTERLGI